MNENFGCSYNLRKCKIIYFLEDDTIKVVEPVVINSGLPQGIGLFVKYILYSDKYIMIDEAYMEIKINNDLNRTIIRYNYV